MLGAIPYTGNKQSLLKDIIPLFPPRKRFIDCFCGGLSVSLNVDGPVVANDIQTELIDMYKWMQQEDFQRVSTERHINALTATNKLAYERVRERYNDTRDSILFYLLIQHSFSHMIRFSKKKFNSPFGRRSFTKNTKRRWDHFKKKKDIQFESCHYSHLDIQSEDFVYCDPPYLITEAAYNSFWNEDEERKLLSWLDSLSARGIKWALSNVLKHRNQTNHILNDWMKSYNVVYLNKNYVLNQFHSDKGETVEILVKNY